ncbi:MAG: hypothetical protein OXH50_12395 [Gemmatimonadetes bacterium]|nr:hypothetical protein [Gemmatimonadota bacterium]
MLSKGWAIPVLWAVWLPCQLCAQRGAEQPEVLEARILYEAAAGLMDRGEYDKALLRFDWISANYKEISYSRLARHRMVEIRRMKSFEVAISPPARVGLTVFGTVYATWVGIGAGILAESEELVYLGMIGGPVVGMVTSLDRTREAPLGNGQASLLALGGAWGTWQGIGVAILAGSEYKGVIAASMGGGALGFAAASSIVGRTWVTAGEATLVNFGGIWGAWFALCAARSLGVTDSDALLASAMAGGNLGLLKTGALAPRLGMSGGRARLINLGGIVGSLYGLGTAVLADLHNREPPTYGMMLAGGTLGLGAGTWFTRNHEATQEFFASRDPGGSPGTGPELSGPGLPVPGLLPSPGAFGGDGMAGPALEVQMDLARLRF